MPIKPKYQILTQPLPLIITSMSVSQNSSGVNFAIITLTKGKKSWKPKFLGISSTKKDVVKAKRPAVNDFVDNLADIVSFIFLQNAKDQMKYKNYILAYHYRLLLIFYNFNQAELDVLFSTNLSFSYGKCNKDSKKALRDIFKSVYHYVKCELIKNITAKANL